MTETDRAKEYLGRIQKSDRLIQRLTDTVIALRNNINSQSYKLDPNKVQSSRGEKRPFEKVVETVVDLEAEINRNIDELYQFKRESYQQICKLPDLDHRSLLIGRYIQGLSWEELADDMGYDTRQIFRLHGQALLAFSEILSVNVSKCH